MAPRGWLVLGSFLSALAAATCAKKQPPAPEIAAPAAKPAPEPLPVVGMEDPFVRLSGDGVKSLKAAYKAMRAKDYDGARVAFAAVVTADPDDTAARMQEVKAAALGGHTADVPALWKELLARDFVAFAGRLDRPKELAPLRAAPEWPRLKSLEASVRPAYAAGLTQALLFVGRTRDPAVKGDDATAKVDLFQEIYAVEPGLTRYRRLTETEGHVFAFSAAPGQKAVSFLVVTTIAAPTGPTPELLDPSVGSVDLETLETVGPFPLGPPGTRAGAVVLGWSGQGEPVWTVRSGNGGAEASYALDATRTAVVGVPLSGAIPTNRTVASPSVITTEGDDKGGKADQVAVSDDRRSLQIAEKDRTLRATRALATDSPRWSPSGQWLVYAGAFDECAPAVPGSKADKNELYLWEKGKGKKAAARIATAPSAFRTRWLDDARLAYQTGVGKQSRIHVLDLATKADTTLKPRAGAAFLGFGAVFCPGLTDEGLEPDDDGAE
jgi:hypothetical protein